MGRLTEDGVLCRNRQVTHHVQNVSATNGISRNHRDNRLRTGTDLTLEIQHVQVMHTAVILITAVVAAYFLIAAGAECLIARASQNDCPDTVIVTGIIERLNHLFYRLRTECVANLRTVNGDFGNAIDGFMVEDIGEVAAAIVPFNRCVKQVFTRIKHSYQSLT